MMDRLNLPMSMGVKETIRQLAEQLTGCHVTDSNIKKIKVHTFSNRVKKLVDSDICVGEDLDKNISSIAHEQVLAIFESRLLSKDEFLVVTPSSRHDSKDATVYLFEKEEVIAIER